MNKVISNTTLRRSLFQRVTKNQSFTLHQQCKNSRMMTYQRLYHVTNQINQSSSEATSSSLSSSSSSETPETVQITFIDSMDKEYKVNAEIGKSLLDVANDNNIELEGACGGELACATCHLIFSKEIYDTLPEKEPEEDDMLDLAFELTDT